PPAAGSRRAPPRRRQPPSHARRLDPWDLERRPRPELDGGVRHLRVPARRDAGARIRRRHRRGDLARCDAPRRGSGPALPLSRTAPLLAFLPSSVSRSSRASGSIVPNWRTGMRVLGLIVITMCTALSPAVAAAQDPAELRKQIEQLQKQLDAVNERLRQLESQ